MGLDISCAKTRILRQTPSSTSRRAQTNNENIRYFHLAKSEFPKKLPANKKEEENGTQLKGKGGKFKRQVLLRGRGPLRYSMTPVLSIVRLIS